MPRMPRAGDELLLEAEEPARAEGRPVLGLLPSLCSALRAVQAESCKQARGCGTCHCTPAASALCIAVAFVCLAGTIVALESATVAHRAPAQPACGVWPNYLPCRTCAYGTAMRPHRVAAGDTCDSLAQQYGTPQFDLFNRNRSMSCCENATIRESDLIDFCRPPTVAQWRAAGHPRPLPPPGEMVSTVSD